MSDVSGSKAERQRREQRGREAEDHAARYLESEGYTILARRHRTPAGEVDLIAFDGEVLAFVEVKARASVGRGLFSLSERQAARIAAAAEFFTAENSAYSDAMLRLDLIIIAPGQAPAHFRNAWQSDGCP